MAIFKYKDAFLSFEPDKGYRNLVTSEWEASPVDAVSGYVNQAPEEREDFVTLARRVQDFWAAHATEGGIEGFEEVSFDD
ncbi:hypothetical protein [Desulfoferula mesophila]|uniref:Uncharacterized protein n=1 Tax=Desulfoferula mesophila TaxID=3058419 RepID=A0AAU9ESB7_9BACT|nr:hypothetical protein FAK_37720 [Desulfoferula mesophilus]